MNCVINMACCLIFDEVITAFGRVGDAFAASRLGVTPDLMTVAKGITSGTVPMGGVIVKQELHDALMRGPEAAIELFHGYTYSGHPVASAAALAALDVYENEQLFSRSRALEKPFEDALHGLRNLPHVNDIRNFGLAGAVEFASRPEAPGARASEVYQRCLDAGLLVRATGDIIAVAPPLIIDEEQIDFIASTLRRVISETA